MLRHTGEDFGGVRNFHQSFLGEWIRKSFPVYRVRTDPFKSFPVNEDLSVVGDGIGMECNKVANIQSLQICKFANTDFCQTAKKENCICSL